MARKSKNGTKAKGIVAKENGLLYIVLPGQEIKNGEKKYTRVWINTTFTNTPENVKKAIAMRNEMLKKANSIVNKNFNTFGDYVLYFLKTKKREIEDTTYNHYSYSCGHIINFLGNKQFKEINKSLIEDFYDYILEGGKRHKRTLKDIKTLLKTIINQAVEEKLMASNPMKKAKVNVNLLSQYAVPKKPGDDFFSFEEAQSFLAMADKEFHDDDESICYFEIFYVVLYFALRREEILGLKWSAIDLNGHKLFINSTVTKGTQINYVNKAKTDSSIRDYPLTDEQVEMFRRLKERENRMRTLFGNKYVENDYVFKNADGSLYYPDTISRVYKKFKERHPELPQSTTLHKLRKTCVCILIHMGFDIEKIHKWIGHKDIKTTLIWYADAKAKEAKQEISEKLKDLYTLKTNE